MSAASAYPEGASTRTQERARWTLEGRQRGVRALVPFLGPAFLAAVAYVDPGNFATNIQSGAAYGYRLLWVVVLASALALLFQTLSAKLGIATGCNLPEVCRARWPRPVVWAMWGLSEVAAMATDVAEFLGASLALHLLFAIPLLPATGITGGATTAVLLLERRGFRPLEVGIAALIGVIAVGYGIESVWAHPDWLAVAAHAVRPWEGGPRSWELTVGIVGATIMPHVVYLHSGLTQHRVVPRTAAETRQIFRWEKWDVGLAMTVAALINLAMLYMAAAVFHPGHAGVADLTTAYRTLTPLLGGGAALVFLIALLASGLSSSAVGTLAGQVIMQGFVGFRIPVWLRRLVTMAPTVLLVAAGANPTQTLVLSQVILSVVLPVPLLALTTFTNRADVMGPLVNSRWVAWTAILGTAGIIALNAILVLQTLGTF